MDLLSHLRQATKDLHEATEEYSNASKIIDYSIEQKEYISLLQENYIAYKSIECAIAEKRPHTLLDKLMHTPEISSWISKDLNGDVPQASNTFRFNSAIEALGGIYVITGSLLGGALLGKHLLECKNIQGKEHNFYSIKDRSRIGRWQNFKKEMSSSSFTPSEEESIIQGANKAFQLFLDVFKTKNLTV